MHISFSDSQLSNEKDIPTNKNTDFDDSKKITIGYFGTLLKNRGGKIIDELLTYENVNVISGGWIADEFSTKLIEKKRYHFLGVLKQDEVLQILKNEVDFLMCCYRK